VSHPSCYHIGYSLSCAEYDDLLTLADGRCMICRVPTGPLFIDHDHRLGQWAVRGLVCNGCNQHLKCIDARRREPAGAAARYLASAWHLRQQTSGAKAARMKRRTTCVRCGIEVAAYTNGKPYRHWSRMAGEGETICTAA
jgi:hypothetical protein